MSFSRAIAYILRPDVEGGLSDDPEDLGQLTNLGISQRSHPNMTPDEIRALTPTTVAPIYLREFWTPINGDQLPDPTSFVLFDLAVNSGVPEAIRLLQQALNVTVDGVMGPQTIRAACVIAPKNLVRDLSEARLSLMEAQSNYARFGKGWRRRVIQTAIEAFL